VAVAARKTKKAARYQLALVAGAIMFTPGAAEQLKAPELIS